MKVVIKVAPTGLYNARPWPRVGETIDLPDHVAEGMIANGHAAKVESPKPAPKPVEKRPAPSGDVETRSPARKQQKRAEKS